MASIANDPGGRRRILFVNPNGDRKAIRLGKVSGRAAEGVKYRVEQLLESIMLRRPMEADLAQWVADLDSRMAKKLAAVGLIPKPESKAAATLGPFLTAYLDGRTDLKPATKIVQGQVIRDLTEFFGESRDVQGIVPGHADDFKQWLIGRGLAPTTIHKRLQVARSFFHAMRRRKLIDENPFEGVKAAATGIKDRQRFVTWEEIARVLGRLPEPPLADNRRPGPLRRPALPERSTFTPLAGHRLGSRPDRGAISQDRTPPRQGEPHDPSVCRATADPGRSLRPGPRRRGIRGR